MTVQPDSRPLRRCFSTLGCAHLELAQVCELAGEFGIPAIELRGLGHRMNLPEYCDERGLRPSQFRAICRKSQIQPIVAGSSIKLTSAEAGDREELLALCAWAERLGVPYVRVFGGGKWGQTLMESDYARAAEIVSWWRKEQASRNWRVELLLETHDAFSASEACLRLNELLIQPLHLIWDSHPPWRVGG